MDKTGPIVVASEPQPEGIGVPIAVRPWILLDEYPARNSIEGAVFISPEPEDGFDIKIRGKRVFVRFRKNLPENRTVVVTFGAGIRDLNGNQMSESYVMAFSTGEKIDRARISGYLKNMENPAAAWILGYPLESKPNPDPQEDRAPFATQPDLDGYFSLSFLPVGMYRLFAVEDSRRNRLWDSDRERIAFPPADVLSAEVIPPSVNLALGACDLSPPSLRGSQALHRQALRLSFDEPIDISGLGIEALNQEGNPLSIINAYFNPADSTALLLTTAMQQKGDVYSLKLTGLSDRAGNLADSISAEIPASIQVDSIGPHLTWSNPTDGETDVSLEATISLGFSEALTLIDLPRAVTLMDPDSQSVAGDWTYPQPALGILNPSGPLRSNTRYTITLVGDSLRDVFGNRSPDSLIRIGFTTIDLENAGAVTGQVTNASNDLHVVADGLDGKKSWDVMLTEDDCFRIERLPAASYRLWLYRDLDGNGRLSIGKWEPFTFAEPFTVARDTIRVRPRWETEGVSLNWDEPGSLQALEEETPKD